MADNVEYLAYNIIQQMYYPKETANKNNEEYIINKYAREDTSLIFGEGENINQVIGVSENSYIEVPDRLTNVNGSHIYKLISSKDIDWENVLLKYSAVPNTNWGDFDTNRRWSATENGAQITINDVYELMNVIDYLLCSCENLWDEINKLKYNKQADKLLFYVFNATNADELGKESNKISNDNPITQKTYLNVFSKGTGSSSLTSELSEFGMATEIYNTDAFYNIYIIKEGNGQIIPGLTNKEKLQYLINTSSSKNNNGILTTIYGNPLYNEIKLYPSANIYNFINNNKYAFDDIIDYENKKFLYDEVFCIDYRFNPTDVTFQNIPFFRKVYIDFYRSNNSYDNFIIYFISNGIKYIIYNSDDTLISIFTDNNEYEDYQSKYYNYSELSVLQQNTVFNNYNQPHLYTISDKYIAKFRISTQGNISEIPTMSIDINLDYYKNKNVMQNSVYINENGSEVLVNPIVDINEETNTLYNNTKERYNLPADPNISIIIKTNATYLNTNTVSNDPNKEWLKNVYEDIMLYPIDNHFEDQFHNIVEDNIYSISEDTNNHVISFSSLVTGGSINFSALYKLYDCNNQQFGIVYRKNENPYKLSYELNINPYLTQEEKNYNTCKNIINNIQNEINYNTSNSNLTFSYDLGNLEQIKFDFKLSINETPKVIGTSNVLPINLNKIYNPTINFISNSISEEELEIYNNENIYKHVLRYSTDNTDNPLSDKYEEIPESSGQYYKKLSDILREEYNYKKLYNVGNINNYKDIIDILYNGNSNNITSHSELSYNINYNTNDYPCFISYYDNSYSYISLLGAEFTQKILPNKQYLTYFTYINDNINNIKSYYMFNINNLSSNYRAKGGNDDWINIYQNNTIGDQGYRNKNPYKKYAYYNSYINVVKNDLNNLTYFMDININNIFNAGITQQTTINKESIYSNIVSTNSFEVIKDQYKLLIFKEKLDVNAISTDNELISNNLALVTYVPILSMHLLSSTFEAKFTPTNSYYNFNNELTNYNQFVSQWNSSESANNSLDRYYISNIQLQLQQNRTRDLPFFNQSNIAQTNIKILRHTPDLEDISGSKLSITSLFKNNTDKILYFDINKEYYFADLYNINKNDNNVVIGCMPYKNNGTIYFNNYTTHTSNIEKINQDDDTTYILKYVEDLSDGSNENFYKCNKFTIDNPESFLSFLNNEDQPISLKPIFEYNDNKTYFSLDIYKLKPIETDTDIDFRGNINTDTKNAVLNLFRLNENGAGVQINIPKLSTIKSNFKFLNYNTTISQFNQPSNFSIKLLSRYKSSLISEYNNGKLIFDTDDEVEFEEFKYISIVERDNISNNSTNNYYEMIIGTVNDNDEIIGYKILNEDTNYKQLSEFEKYKYQIRLFFGINNNLISSNFMCDYEYFMNNFDGLDITDNTTRTSQQNSTINIY